MNTNKGSKVIPVNFNTDFGIKILNDEVLNKQKEEEELESDSQSEMVSVRYEFGITIRSDSIRDLLDQIKPICSKSHPVLDSSQSDV
jgi:hypothetical protein